jgi:hypothetical protein
LFLYIIGHSYPKFTVHNALSYYSIKHSDRQDYHVTACFSPRGKYLAGSPYQKSPAVGKALGEISQLSIIGCVITKDTFSARVSLTEKQRALWMNDDQTGQQPQGKRGKGCGRGALLPPSLKNISHPLKNILMSVLTKEGREGVNGNCYLRIFGLGTWDLGY